MYMIQITEEKQAKMAELCEKGMKAFGKLMSCIEEMDGEHNMRWDDEEEMSRYNMRGRRYRY